MSPRVVVVIRENPRKTHRAVEALRIALGLSTGELGVTVVLLGEAPLLIARGAADDVVDGEILEKYLPSLRHMGIPIVVATGTESRFRLLSEFSVRELSLEAIRSLVAEADRTIVF